MDGGSHIVHALVIAHGRVHGVFYRETMRREAQARGLAGSAVNLADGTVECHFEGPRSLVDQMIEIARSGPPAAEVTRLEINWTRPAGLQGFRTGEASAD